VCGLAIVVAAIATAAAPSASVLGWALLAALLAVVGAAILVWGFAYRRLTYALGEQSLGVTWCGQTLVVPYASVEGIYTGQRLVGSSVPKVLTWPGIYVGPGRARGIRRLRFFATSPEPSALTLIAGENVGLVVSAREPLAFRNALIERVQAFEPTEGESTAWVKRNEASAPWTAIRDRWFGGCLGATFLFLMLTLGAIVFGFGALPPEIAVRFDAIGQATHIASAEALLRLPLVGLVLALVNAGLGVVVHPRERLLARLLWIGGAVLLGIVFVAVVRLLQ
jgi:Bacterial PH domain